MKPCKTFLYNINICDNLVEHISLDRAVELALENNLDLQSKRKKAEELKQIIIISMFCKMI